MATGFGRALIDRRYNGAVGGLFGCTSVIVASQQAVWMSHFWEITSFRTTIKKAEDTFSKGTPATAEDSAQFNQHVINKILHGDNTDIPGLLPCTIPGGQFHSTQKPVWTIVTPRARFGGPGQSLYGPEIEQIQRVLQYLFPHGSGKIVNYIARGDPHSQANTPSGKVLFQYDPLQGLMDNPHNPCEVFQMAMSRLWVEDTLIWEITWAAEANQRIPGLLAHYQLKHKRDNPTCRSPSSLPQASTELTGHDLTPNQAANPDTLWITLGGAGPTTAASSTRGRSSTPAARAKTVKTASGAPPTTPAPTATPHCVAAGAPWMSPPIFCICRLTAYYPTHPPIRGATTGNCAYSVLPSSTIHPITTSSVSILPYRRNKRHG